MNSLCERILSAEVDKSPNGMRAGIRIVTFEARSFHSHHSPDLMTYSPRLTRTHSRLRIP